MEFTFSVRSSGLDISNDAQVDRLFNPDISILIAERDSEIWLSVDLDASSEADAFQQLVTHIDVAVPGVHIDRIDLDLVTVTEIATRLDISRETVRLWTTGKRRQDFPVSFGQAGDSRIWAWADVYEWVLEQGIVFPDVYALRPLGLRFTEAKNVSLAKARDAKRHGWIIQTQTVKPVAAQASGFAAVVASLEDRVYPAESRRVREFAA
ncbi:hypothetical protein EDF39_0462 [Frondihabitans sp. PhB161]|nr:hypothetical protein EDF37_0461 [Frondihabitans sp. PhB153]RPF08080.1 hypothetical protein EDF39_0462 [Frondihabitans sp. PhB161]